MRYSLTRTGTTYTTLASDLLASVKEFIGVSDAGQDSTVVTPLIEDAIRYVEDKTGIVLALSTWEQKQDRFPVAGCDLLIRKPPVASITSVVYVATDDSSDTWDSARYDTDLASWPGRIRPAPDYTWPTTRGNQLDAVTVTFTAGYSALANLHPAARRAINLLVSHWWYHREAVGTFGDAVSHSLDACLYDLRWSA